MEHFERAERNRVMIGAWIRQVKNIAERCQKFDALKTLDPRVSQFASLLAPMTDEEPVALEGPTTAMLQQTDSIIAYSACYPVTEIIYHILTAVESVFLLGGKWRESWTTIPKNLSKKDFASKKVKWFMENFHMVRRQLDMDYKLHIDMEKRLSATLDSIANKYFAIKRSVSLAKREVPQLRKFSEDDAEKWVAEEITAAFQKKDNTHVHGTTFLKKIQTVIGVIRNEAVDEVVDCVQILNECRNECRIELGIPARK